ncbi:SDR family NAD(P)-dependent oxidoreductase [Muricoccus radiodurans]|uniref:SDR family NAD(P)-dependent oxidoreductase n=1 Tax=Muricoccus radiodurans TaxID=2231721 RepID=UPI003CEC1434
MQLLKDRVAVITGPAKGMGAATTLLLADHGADLALVGRDTAAIEPVAAEARAKGRRAEIYSCDLMNPGTVDAMAAAVLRDFGRCDVLVNVAGGTGPLGKTFWETTPEEFDEINRLNVTGPFLTMRAFAPAMIAARRGKIVNVGGTFGLRGKAGRAAYSASKWGLRGITKSAALELGPHDINVNCVCPGMIEGDRFTKVRTEMSRRMNISMEEAREIYAGDYALRRISTDQDIAGAVLFLASDLSRQVTGQDLAVDGGWVI